MRAQFGQHREWARVRTPWIPLLDARLKLLFLELQILFRAILTCIFNSIFQQCSIGVSSNLTEGGCRKFGLRRRANLRHIYNQFMQLWWTSFCENSYRFLAKFQYVLIYIYILKIIYQDVTSCEYLVPYKKMKNMFLK